MITLTKIYQYVSDFFYTISNSIEKILYLIFFFFWSGPKRQLQIYIILGISLVGKLNNNAIGYLFSL